MKKILIILVLVIAAMFFTKPDEEHFQVWYKERLSQNNGDEGNALLHEAIKGALKLQSDITMNYEDRHLYAVVEIGKGLDKVKFLGLFGTWVKMETQTAGKD